MSPQISIIVPVYNAEQYLDKCVQSILNQTFTDFELILVDDGARDHSGQMCDGWEKRDSRIRVVHKENGGLSSAKNAGLDIVKGKYVSFVDSDDWLLPDALQVMSSAAASQEACCVVMDVILVWDSNRMQVERSGQYGVFSTHKAIENLFMGKLKNYSPAKLYPVEAWNGVRFPDGKNFEDISTTFKVFEKCNCIKVIEYAGYCYLQRKGSITDRALLTRQDAIDAYSTQLDAATQICPNAVKYLEYRIEEAKARYFVLQIYHNSEPKNLKEQVNGIKRWLRNNLFDVLMGKYEPMNPNRCRILIIILISIKLYGKLYMRYIKMKEKKKIA